MSRRVSQLWFASTPVGNRRGSAAKYLCRQAHRGDRQAFETHRQFDVAKYAFALERLQAMLANETETSEAQWQLEIVEIILLLNPRYIKAFTEVRLWDADASTWRRIDILLVDASGNVDVIEIKKPMEQAHHVAGALSRSPSTDARPSRCHGAGHSLPEAS